MFRKLITIFAFIFISTYLLKYLELYEGFISDTSPILSSECCNKFAPETLKNKLRAFKYPHYYGYGTGSGFHYGEPYYIRNVEY